MNVHLYIYSIDRPIYPTVFGSKIMKLPPCYLQGLLQARLTQGAKWIAASVAAPPSFKAFSQPLDLAQ